MINWQLIRCAFGYHRFGDVVHDGTLNRWERRCDACLKIVEVAPPRDRHNVPYDPHTWYLKEYERKMKEYDKCLEQT